MLVKLMDYKKVEEYDRYEVPNGILKCHKNNEYSVMEFKVIPRIGEIVLLSQKGTDDWLFSWKVVGVYHFNEEVFLVVNGLNNIWNFI